MRLSGISIGLRCFFGFLGATAILGCDGPDDSAYVQTNLLSDRTGLADHVDRDLINPWGLAYGPGTAFWIANEGSATSTIVDANGRMVGPRKIETQDAPTGLVYNPTGGFEIRAGSHHAPSTFLYATETGMILGWNQRIDPERTVVAHDDSASGSRYKGLALVRTRSRALLYAADFHEGEIDVYDTTFHPATGLAAHAFEDPSMPAGYAPFGISAIGERLYVTYARQDSAREDEVPGRGAGFIDVYEADGRLVRRLASRGELDAPWAVVRAPASFGAFGGMLLVGNFGDGRILAFDPDDGTMLGALEDREGDPLVIEGLWGLAFGNGRYAGRSDTLYFTAGIDDERHGLFGSVAVMK